MNHGVGLRGALAAGSLAMTLVACSKAPEAPPSIPSPAPQVEDRFGPVFSNAFHASPNSTPIDPTARDVAPVNSNLPPVQVP